MSKHNFVESTKQTSEYQRIIYCTWCGKVAWHFNRSETSVKELQDKIKEPCVYVDPPSPRMPVGIATK
jgi:hypothetical protein